MSVVYFLLMLGWGFGMAGRDAFFVTQAGPDKLPFVYILNAATLVVFSSVYSRIVDRISRYNLFIILLAFMGFILFLLRWIIPQDWEWVPFAIFILSDLIVNVLMLMHFWTLANDIFDPREGKRIFPIIGGAGLTGVILGGALTPPIVSWIGTANLFLLWSCILFGLIPCIFWIKREAESAGIEAWKNTKNQISTSGDEDRNGLKEIWQHPLIRRLAYVSIPMFLVVNIVDYQFFKAMAEIFQDQDKLSGFLGILGSAFSVGGLFLQLFVTTKLLTRFGVGITILIHPMSMTIGALFLVARSLFTPMPVQSVYSFRAGSAIFASFTDDGIATSTGESASQLLYNAIPENKRGRSRAFICGSIEPISAILSGFFLLFLLSMGFTELHLALTLVGICCCWIFLSLEIKSKYFQALVNNLGSNHDDLRDAALENLSTLNDQNIRRTLLEALASNDDEVSLYALAILKEEGSQELVENLCCMLPRTSPKIKIALLALLSNYGPKNVLSSITPLLENTDSSVRAAAVKAVGRLGGYSELKILENYSEDADISVRAEAIIALIRWNNTHSNKVKDGEQILKEMLRDSGISTDAKIVYIIGEAKVTKMIPLLIDLFDSKDREMQRTVISVSGKMEDERMVAPLIRSLENERLTPSAIRAILNLGNLAIDPLHYELKSSSNGEEVKKHIVFCLGKICSPNSIPVLFDVLQSQECPISLRHSAISTLCLIKEKLMTLQSSDFPDSDKDLPHSTLALLKGKMLGAKDHVRVAVMETFFPKNFSGLVSNFLKKITRDMQNKHNSLRVLKNAENQPAVLLLRDVLERIMVKKEEIALRYLELLSDPQTISKAALNLKSKEHRDRAEAIEVLDSCSSEAKDFVEFLEKKYLGRSPKWYLNDLSAVLINLLNEYDNSWLQICTIYAIGELKIRDLCQPLTDWYRSKDPEQNVSTLRYHVLLALRKMGPDPVGVIDFSEIEKMELNMKRMLFLRSAPLFSDLEGNDLKWINAIIREEEYQKGEIIFKEDDEGDALYIVERGSVRIVTGGENQIVLAVLQEKECFGEMSLLDRQPRSATAEVIKDSKLLVIKQEDFQDILIARPKIAFSLIKTLTKRLRSTLNALATIKKYDEKTKKKD